MKVLGFSESPGMKANFLDVHLRFGTLHFYGGFSGLCVCVCVCACACVCVCVCVRHTMCICVWECVCEFNIVCLDKNVYYNGLARPRLFSKNKSRQRTITYTALLICVFV